MQTKMHLVTTETNVKDEEKKSLCLLDVTETILHAAGGPQ